MEPIHFCDCMRRTVVKTSWTDLNPGRRFRTCDRVGENGCGLFQWVDPPMCPRSREVIPGLLKRLNRGEHEVQKYKKREKAWYLLFVVLLIIIFFFIIDDLANGVGEGDGKKQLLLN